MTLRDIINWFKSFWEKILFSAAELKNAIWNSADISLLDIPIGNLILGGLFWAAIIGIILLFLNWALEIFMKAFIFYPIEKELQKRPISIHI
jgi:hypothetical protein